MVVLPADMYAHPPQFMPFLSNSKATTMNYKQKSAAPGSISGTVPAHCSQISAINIQQTQSFFVCIRKIKFSNHKITHTVPLPIIVVKKYNGLQYRYQ